LFEFLTRLFRRRKHRLETFFFSDSDGHEKVRKTFNEWIQLMEFTEGKENIKVESIDFHFDSREALQLYVHYSY